MKKLNAAAAILTIVGGLNWGLVGLASQLGTLISTSQPTPTISVNA